jgi:putative peptidoglycan lipid II flippase
MIKILAKQQKGIGSAALILANFTILAQLLAIVKNKLLSVYFGESIELDVFYTAFKIPDLIYLFVGGLAIGSILIPIFTEKENISIEEKEKFMSRFFNSYFLILISISLVVFFSLPFLIPLIFPGFEAHNLELLIKLSRILILSPIFMSLANFFISINQRNKLFFPMALTGFLYNLAIIFSLIFFAPKFGIQAVV